MRGLHSKLQKIPRKRVFGSVEEQVTGMPEVLGSTPTVATKKMAKD